MDNTPELELWDDSVDKETTIEDTTKEDIKDTKEDTPEGEDKSKPEGKEKVVVAKKQPDAGDTTKEDDKAPTVVFSAEEKEVIKSLKSKKAEDLTDEESDIIKSYDESTPKVEINFDRLKERGYLQLPENFEFDGTEEKEEELLAYNERLKREAYARELYSELPEDFKPILEYVLAGGQDYKSLLNIPEVDSITEEDLSDETKAEAVLHQFYKNKGFTEAKIKKLVDAAKTAEELTVEAKDALTSLKKDFEVSNTSKVNQQKAAKAKEVEDAQENQRVYVNTIKSLKEVAGYKLTDGDKQKLINSNLRPVRIKTDDGHVETTEFNYKLNQYMNDPSKFALLQFYIMSDFNIPNQVKRADTEAVKKLQEKLKLLGKESVQSKARGGKSSLSKPNFDLEKAELG